MWSRTRASDRNSAWLTLFLLKLISRRVAGRPGLTAIKLDLVNMCYMQSVLDVMGGEAGTTTMSEGGELLVARDEAVFLYTLDGRGPCFVFEGKFTEHHN